MNGHASSEIPQWGSSLGFLLAALGSAIGIGNIWRFSYVVGENGGGAFIVIYLLAVAILGLPLLIAELAIGQRGHANPVTAFARIAPTMPWRLAGWPGVIGSVAILAYYPVIAGWVARYLWVYTSDEASARGMAGHAAYFESFIASPVQPLFWFALVIAVAAVIVAAGVERGIERASRILMPVFALLVLLLAGYGLALPGAPRALTFLFAPDWSVLGEPRTYLAAIGQAFFSIGLAMGILVTYGGYLSPGEKLPRAALVIAAGDTMIALLAGLVIFPAVFTHGIDPAQGPTLAFVVLPEVFAAMPAGRWIAAAFFLLLLVAALTSVIALLEVPVSLVMAKWRLRRPRAVLLVAGGVLLLGMPVALGYGPLHAPLPGGRLLLDMADHLASNLVLPLSGIAIALFAGWAWPKTDAMRMSGLAHRRLQILWLWLLRLVVPAIIALVMLRGF